MESEVERLVRERVRQAVEEHTRPFLGALHDWPPPSIDGPCSFNVLEALAPSVVDMPAVEVD